MSEGGLGTKLHAESGPLTCGYALRDVTWAGAQAYPRAIRRSMATPRKLCDPTDASRRHRNRDTAQRPPGSSTRQARPGVVLVRPTPSLAGDSQLNVIEGQAPALPVTLVQ